MEKKVFQTEIGGRILKTDLTNLAEKASGNALLSYGETVVLATAVISKEEKKESGFFPLTVEYQERYYAAGKILGSRFIRRESRPSDEAIITARLIDRVIRPLFPEQLSREVQIIVTCLSWDRKNDPDFLGALATSLALSISEIPWNGPIGILRVGKVDGKFIINPTYEERERSFLDIIFGAVKRKNEILINMIEAESQEVEEQEFLNAFDFAKKELKKIIDFQEEIVKETGKKKIIIKEVIDKELEKKAQEFLEEKMKKIIFDGENKDKTDELEKLKNEMLAFFEKENNDPIKKELLLSCFQTEMKKILNEEIIKTNKRPDGRKINEIRKITCSAGVLPRTHGSGLFCRGQTKSLSILTLGAPGDVKLLEGMALIGKKRFMHHYNFPPYSAGEIKPIRGPGRREVGHGMLVEKALLPVIPSFEEFPYTLRIVSEILSSNGSTSMASCCSSSLALMDAGVPIKRAVAGISLGLVVSENNHKILTDIQGPEDHYGNMDFKIAGTEKGITAIQMDVKIEGISKNIMKEALENGKEARLKILEEMKKVLEKPRPSLSQFAPRILTLQINPEKIREVIGPGGKMINEIIEECGVSIDIEDSGKIFVTAEKEEAAKKAISWIKNITREIKIGEVFHGKVKKILDFGIFVEILPGQEGLIHISRLPRWQGKKIESMLKVGEIIPVKVISIDDLGRINLVLNNNLSSYERRRN